MKFWAVSWSVGNWTTIFYFKKITKTITVLKNQTLRLLCFVIFVFYFVYLFGSFCTLFLYLFVTLFLFFFCGGGGGGSKGESGASYCSVKPATGAYCPPISFPDAVTLLASAKYNPPLDQGNEYAGGVIDYPRHFSLLRTSRLLFVISYFQLTWWSLVR